MEKKVKKYKFDELSAKAQEVAIEQVRDDYYNSDIGHDFAKWATDDDYLFEPNHDEMVALFGYKYKVIEDSKYGDEPMIGNTRKNLYWSLDRNRHIDADDAIVINNDEMFLTWLGIPKDMHDKVYYRITDNGHRYADTVIEFEPNDSDYEFTDEENEILTAAEEKFRNHMDSVLDRIEADIDYRYSDEAIRDDIEGNDTYYFFASGKIAKGFTDEEIEEMKRGGSVKQIAPQYGHKSYGVGDKQRKAKPVGYRYIRIVDKKTGRLRPVTKDDREYYMRPSARLIKAYEDKDNPMHKKARKMLYFERRADHSDAEGRKMRMGGGVSRDIKERLEYLRGQLRSERITFNELLELESLAKYIDPSDVELLQAAGVHEYDDEYSKEGNLSVKKIVSNFTPVAVKHDGNSKDGYSVLIKDKKSDFTAWVDVWISGNDVETDWNKYIFKLDEPSDVLQKSLQENNYIFDLATSEAISYLENKGLINQSDDASWSYNKGGAVKQIAPQYGHKSYGVGDKQRKAKPVGYRYIRIVDKKTGRLRPVTKDDREYYMRPSARLIKAYEDKDNPMHKKARKMLYFERRADHSDQAPLKSLKKYAGGGSVTIGERKAKYQVKYKLNDDDKQQLGYIVEVRTPDGNGVDYYILYNKKKDVVKEMSLQEAQQMVNDKKIVLVKTYNIKDERLETDVEKSVEDMNYSERRNWIQDHIIPHLKSASLSWNDFQGGSYDYYDEKEKARFLKEARIESDYSSPEKFEKETDYKVDDWSIVTKDGEELDEVASDNTYNWSYLGLITWNFRVYKADEEKYFLIAHPHMGGDVRVNYGEPIIFEDDSEESVLYKFHEKVIDGRRTIYLDFKDGKSLTFEAQQYSDVNYFELVDKGQKLKLNSPAKLTLSTFETLGSWYGDDFLIAIVDEFEREHRKKKKEYGGRYADGGVVVGNDSLEISYSYDDLEGLYEMLGEHDVITANEINEGSDTLLLSGGEDLYLLTNKNIRELIETGKTNLQYIDKVDNYINKENENHISFMKWLRGDDYEMLSKGGRMKSIRQKREQYHDREVEKYGSRDGVVKARPVGYRYRKVRKNGRLRPVTKNDKEYYGSVTKKDIKLYEEGNKDARRRIYFENRKDHSDKNPKSNRGY